MQGAKKKGRIGDTSDLVVPLEGGDVRSAVFFCLFFVLVFLPAENFPPQQMQTSALLHLPKDIRLMVVRYAIAEPPLRSHRGEAAKLAAPVKLACRSLRALCWAAHPPRSGCSVGVPVS
jgi:hypothetical protein